MKDEDFKSLVVKPLDITGNLTELSFVLKRVAEQLKAKPRNLDAYRVEILGNFSDWVRNEVARLYSEAGWKIAQCYIEYGKEYNKTILYISLG